MNAARDMLEQTSFLCGRPISCKKICLTEHSDPSLGLRSSSCRYEVQEPEAGTSYLVSDPNNTLVVSSSSRIDSQDYESSTSNSANLADFGFESGSCFSGSVKRS
ncbi:unnamed protein product [Eruca vesicaria subsp. sativa]|uniref:Uncharacterized protein n=1 Tax=Eruca vesicaria subsp. sativa TaxID=29727 RepID=A0ABC8K9C7_ERUVS|nr:unnamed protein product [Eruca vesicaria subsp. sativa]